MFRLYTVDQTTCSVAAKEQREKNAFLTQLVNAFTRSQPRNLLETEIMKCEKLQSETGPTGQGPSASLGRLAYGVSETAEILGVSEKTVRRLISRRLLRASRALRHLLIPKKEIERFLDDTARQ